MNDLFFVLQIFVMTFSGTLGAFFLKKGASKLAQVSILKMLAIKEIYFGGFFYVLGAVFNILLLRTRPYTVVYPSTSLTYIWTIFVSAIFLHEKITVWKVLAILLIVAGVVFISI